MVRIFLILIGLMIPCAALSWDCSGGGTLVVTAPRPGARTYHDSITVRGFLCEKIHFVVVRNVTTEQATLTDTDEICEEDDCVYAFSTLIDDLAVGSNELTATVPGHDPPIEVRIEVIRTALAGLW